MSSSYNVHPVKYNLYTGGHYVNWTLYEHIFFNFIYFTQKRVKPYNILCPPVYLYYHTLPNYIP